MRACFPEPPSITIPYTFFKQQVEAGNVESVTSVGDSIRGTFKTEVTYPPEHVADAGAERAGLALLRPPEPRTSKRFETQRPAFADPGLETLLEEKGVVIEARDESGLVLVQAARRLRPHAAADRRLRLAEPPRRGGGRRRAVRPRPQPRQALQRGAAEGHLRRRRRHRRGRERAGRDRRLPEEPRQVPAARRHRCRRACC